MDVRTRMAVKKTVYDLSMNALETKEQVIELYDRDFESARVALESKFASSQEGVSQDHLAGMFKPGVEGWQLPTALPTLGRPSACVVDGGPICLPLRNTSSVPPFWLS